MNTNPMLGYNPTFSAPEQSNELIEVEKALDYRRHNTSYFTTFHTNNKTFFEN